MQYEPGKPGTPGGTPSSRIASFPLVYLLLGFPMFVAAFGNLPQKLDAGPISAMGALTIVEVVVAAAGLLMCGRFPKRLLLRTSPYWAFLAWVLLSMIWAPPQTPGFQNALVYILFGEMVLFGGTLAARDPIRTERLLRRGVLWISCVALGIVALELVVHGLPGDFEESWWIGPRPVAILGLITLSRFMAGWYYGDRWARVWIVLWIGAVVASISRAVTAISLGLVCLVVLGQVRFRRRRVALTLPAAVTTVALVLGLALTWKPFYDRMFSGDVATVGGTSINVSGRAKMWLEVIHSGLEAPIVGKGLGSAQAVVAAAFADTPSQMTQPHDDYLRIWHDLGAIGIGFYLLATLSWMWILARTWYAAEEHGRRPAILALSGLLSLVALAMVELTDNPVVYQAVMGTAGVVIGAGLGARLDAPHARDLPVEARARVTATGPLSAPGSLVSR